MYIPLEQSSSIQPSSHRQTPGYMHTPFTHSGLQVTVVYNNTIPLLYACSQNNYLQSSSIMVTVANVIRFWYGLELPTRRYDDIDI